MGRKGPMTISPSAKAELLRRIAALGGEVDKVEAEYEGMRAVLQELYEAAHEYLNAPDAAGRIAAGTPRLNAALGAAFKALHEP
jgi:hypothetical protein